MAYFATFSDFVLSFFLKNFFIFSLIFLLSSFAFASFNLFVTILLIKIFFKTSSLTSAINVPSFATDTLPVSSETIIAKLSDSFEIPIPALCLVPSSYAISWSPAKGNIHAAAAILLLLITTAPSCKGVFGTNIFTNNCGDTSESNGIPVAIISFI